MEVKHFLQELNNPVIFIDDMGQNFIDRYCGGIISSNQMHSYIAEHDTSLEALVAIEEHFRKIANSGHRYESDGVKADEVKALIEHLDKTVKDILGRLGTPT